SIAFLVASSQDVRLVPMTSMTRYTPSPAPFLAMFVLLVVGWAAADPGWVATPAAGRCRIWGAGAPPRLAEGGPKRQSLGRGTVAPPGAVARSGSPRLTRSLRMPLTGSTPLERRSHQSSVKSEGPKVRGSLAGRPGSTEMHKGLPVVILGGL